MKADFRLGPLWLAPLRKPLRGAVLGFADACGDASLILGAAQCRNVGAALYRLSRMPVGVGPQCDGEDPDVLALEALLTRVTTS